MKEHPHGGCKRQLQFLPLSPAHPRQYQGRARLPPVLGATKGHLGNPQTNRPHHPDRALPRLAPEGQKSPQARRERLRPAAGARQLSRSPRRGFVLEICCWQIPLGTGISHQQLHGGDVSVCARQG